MNSNVTQLTSTSQRRPETRPPRRTNENGKEYPSTPPPPPLTHVTGVADLLYASEEGVHPGAVVLRRNIRPVLLNSPRILCRQSKHQKESQLRIRRLIKQ
eukprot:GHVU01225438.1.p2 GENE.GHVU01225438.1~~GHVU01225438.1.p2  ORF type:complete len:100 (+),score=4.25 GHVU01225438.1:870-1169(+)